MAYCTREDVNALFGDISDDISDEDFEKYIRNSTLWVNNKLRNHYPPIPIPEEEVEALTAISSFYTASQILNSLDHGDDRIENHNDWYLMAQEAIEDWMGAYDKNDADEDTLVNHQMVKHSHARTYNQKRGRRGVRGWVR